MSKSSDSNQSIPLTKADIAAYIRENLRLKLDHRSDYGDPQGSFYVSVWLDGQLVSEASAGLPSRCLEQTWEKYY